MKSKALVTAILAAGISGAVQAQSSVQLTGLADVYVGARKMAGDSGRAAVVNSGGMTTSWIGFRGSEDLGGGLRASFALTGFIQMDTGVPGRFPNDPFFSRDGSVSLAGSWGAVTAGRALAPNLLPTILFNPFGDSFVFSPVVLHKNVPLFNPSGWRATTPSDTGWSNQVVYSTPKVGGLTANLHYQFGEVAGDSGARNVGANLLYSNGPFGAAAYYERDQISNPVAPAPFPGGAIRTDWMVAGSYDAKVVKGFATYGRARSSGANPTGARTVSVGASAPAGSGKFLAAIARTRTSDQATRNTWSLGYDYDLSKSTDLYAIVMRDSITGFSDGTSFGLGIRKRF